MHVDSLTTQQKADNDTNENKDVALDDKQDNLDTTVKTEKKLDTNENPNEDVVGLEEELEEIELELKSKDNKSFKISKKVAMQSALIKTMWTGDQSETQIPLPNVRGSILKKVIGYMEYHNTNPPKEIEKPLKSANMREV